MLILVTEDAELLKGVLDFFVLADQQPGDRKGALLPTAGHLAPVGD